MEGVVESVSIVLESVNGEAPLPTNASISVQRPLFLADLRAKVANFLAFKDVVLARKENSEYVELQDKDLNNMTALSPLFVFSPSVWALEKERMRYRAEAASWFVLLRCGDDSSMFLRPPLDGDGKSKGKDTLALLGDYALARYGQKVLGICQLQHKGCPIITNDEACRLPRGAVVLVSGADESVHFLSKRVVCFSILFSLFLLVGLVCTFWGLQVLVLKSEFIETKCTCDSPCTFEEFQNVCDGVVSQGFHVNVSSETGSHGIGIVMTSSGFAQQWSGTTKPCFVPLIQANLSYCMGQSSGLFLVSEENFDFFPLGWFVFLGSALLGTVMLFFIITCCASCSCCWKREKYFGVVSSLRYEYVLLTLVCSHLANMSDGYLGAAISLFVALRYSEFRSKYWVLLIFAVATVISDYPYQHSLKVKPNERFWWIFAALLLEVIQCAFSCMAMFCESGVGEKICVSQQVTDARGPILAVVGVAAAESALKIIVHLACLYSARCRAHFDQVSGDLARAHFFFWGFRFPLILSPRPE